MVKMKTMDRLYYIIYFYIKYHSGQALLMEN